MAGLEVCGDGASLLEDLPEPPHTMRLWISGPRKEMTGPGQSGAVSHAPAALLRALQGADDPPRCSLSHREQDGEHSVRLGARIQRSTISSTIVISSRQHGARRFPRSDRSGAVHDRHHRARPRTTSSSAVVAPPTIRSDPSPELRPRRREHPNRLTSDIDMLTKAGPHLDSRCRSLPPASHRSAYRSAAAL